MAKKKRKKIIKKTSEQIKLERGKKDALKQALISSMKDSILKHDPQFPLDEFSGFLSWKYIHTNSFHDMRLHHFDKKYHNLNFTNTLHKTSKIIKCKTIILLPTNDQKNILLDMFEGYRIMYNETNRFIKTFFFENNMYLPNWKYIRTNHLMLIKQELAERYHVYSHTLDGAIRLCYAAYKSCFTNLQNGNIKHFRVRYIKKSKDTKILDIPVSCFFKFHICKKYLTEPMKNNEDFDYSTILRESKIHYNSNTGRFTLLVPEKVDNKGSENIHYNDYISIDPGLRTFLTCVSEDKVVEIGRKVSIQLKKLHTKIDNYSDSSKNESKLKNKTKKLKIKRLREKIKNKVKDMHWKVINYLKSFKNIIIGKWSTKDIIKKESSILKSMDKRVAQSLCFYQFMMRIEYKSKINGNKVTKVKEHYTSQMCSKCGNIKKELGGEKVYKCNECGIKVDRDMNSARNIIIKSLIVK